MVSEKELVMETRDQIIQSIKDDFTAWEAARKAYERDQQEQQVGKPVDADLAKDNVEIMDRLSKTWAGKLRSLLGKN